jgi:hypothetical protein
MSTTVSHQGGGHPPPEGPSAEELAASVAIGHEVPDAHIRPLIYSAIGLAVLIAASFAVVGILLAVAGSTPNATSNTLPAGPALQQQVPPAPRLEQNPRADGDKIIAAATARLEGYGWVDQRAGTAHIPIERAMELLLERGVSGK